MSLRFRLSLIVLASASLLAATTSAQAATAKAGYGDNLIVNPRAEAGPGSPGTTIVLPPSWQPTGAFTAFQYGASGGPTVTDPGPEDRGKNMFAGGPSKPLSTGTQKIKLSIPAADIDAGSVNYELSGWLGGFSSQADRATLTAKFLNKAGASLGHATIGPVTAADRKNTTGLWKRSTTGVLPKGARSVTITLTMVRAEGDYNDGYADNLSFILTKK